MAEEEERKRRMVEYLQWLRDKVLEEETALLERTEGSQVMGSKHKEVTTGDEEGQRPSPRRLEGSNRGSTVEVLQSRWGVLTPVRGVCAPLKVSD